MYFQRDYVLRMIEMMGDFFRRVGEMLDRMEQEREIGRVCRELCGMDLPAALALDDATLEGLLDMRPRLMLSELIYIAANVRDLLPEERAPLCLRALRLLCSLREEGEVADLRGARLRELMTDALPLLTAEDFLRCALFFEAGERFGDVEDALFYMMDAASGDAAAPGDAAHYHAQGRAVLARLALLLPERLALGGLPREELSGTVNDFNALLPAAQKDDGL